MPLIDTYILIVHNIFLLFYNKNTRPNWINIFMKIFRKLWEFYENFPILLERSRNLAWYSLPYLLLVACRNFILNGVVLETSSESQILRNVAVPKPTLGYCQGDSLTQSMSSATCYYNFEMRVTWSLVKILGS